MPRSRRRSIAFTQNSILIALNFGEPRVTDGHRLILPSFGAYTGGLDVGEAAISSLFAGPFHAYMLGQSRVYAIPRCVAV